MLNHSFHFGIGRSTEIWRDRRRKKSEKNGNIMFQYFQELNHKLEIPSMRPPKLK